ncbi:MAG: selenide, water dikinase SelD [Deltaproteobacteria bacterium]|nr:selenide, water dikinase SelD [Deltaproteobacteria bacterium]
MGAEDLVQVLEKVTPFEHPWVDAATAPMDDAALLRPESGPGLVLTVDFITPIVDDAYAYGAIAAANSLSDVYAMGGEPQVALAVCGFPEGEVPLDVLESIFRGGRDKAAEAGCAIVGGHTVIDPEMKYGLCVVGSVDADRALAQTRAREGDRLVLTKPLGFGVAAQAIKNDRLDDADIARVVEIMSALNRGAKDAALSAGAHAATDVTGFGLLGHLYNLASGAGLAARIYADRVPVLDFVRPLVREGVVPGGTRRNLDYVAGHVRWADALEEIDRLVLCDAQTSGGLLIAVPPEGEAALVAALEKGGAHAAASVGELRAGDPGRIEVV